MVGRANRVATVCASLLLMEALSRILCYMSRVLMRRQLTSVCAHSALLTLCVCVCVCVCVYDGDVSNESDGHMCSDAVNFCGQRPAVNVN